MMRTNRSRQECKETARGGVLIHFAPCVEVELYGTFELSKQEHLVEQACNINRMFTVRSQNVVTYVTYLPTTYLFMTAVVVK